MYTGSCPGARALGLAALGACASLGACATPGARRQQTLFRAQRSAPSDSVRGQGGASARPPTPVPDPAKTREVTLPQILAYADKHAPGLRAGRARLELGEAEREAASPLLPDDPQLRVKVGPRFTASGQAVDAQLILLQKLQIAGERGLRLRAADRAMERLRAELSQVRWLTHRQVHAAFRRAQVARERLEAAQRLLDFSERLLDIARRREAAGAISGLQVEVVRGQAAQARQDQLAAESDYRTARLQLAELSGWPAGSPPEPTGELSVRQRIPSVASLLAAARKSYPLLRTARARVVEARARLSVAQREVFPKPMVGVQLNREGEVATSASHIVMGVLFLPIPVWQRNRGPIARAQAQLSVARASERALASRLEARVTRAATAAQAAAKRVRIYGTKVVPRFESNLQMVRRAFEAGKIDVLQVMVARRRFLEIQRQALGAYDAYFRAVAALEATVGAELPGSAPEEVKR